MQINSTASFAMAMILLLGAIHWDASGQGAIRQSYAGFQMQIADKPFITQANRARAATATKLRQTSISIPVVASGARTVTLRHAGLDFSVGDMAEGLARSWSQFEIWLRETYARQPVVAIALVALMLLPFLAIPGLLGRRPKRGRYGTGPDNFDTGKQQSNDLGTGWTAPLLPGPAWVRIEGEDGKAMRIVGEMLRIGRESDNDVCLGDRSVHRYHALIHRTSDAEFCITDLSGDKGNGIFVNGVKLRAAILGSGDLIQLGMVGVRFEQG